LLAVAKNGVRACPALGSDLQQALEGLHRRLSCDVSPSLVKVTGRQVEEQLQQWAGRSAEYFKAKTNDVKELLIALASTAESMGKQDQRYAKRLGDFTTQFQTIADLDDLAQMRATLVKRAAELKNCVDEMAQDTDWGAADLGVHTLPTATRVSHRESYRPIDVSWATVAGCEEIIMAEKRR
jgi:hypothetical protein